MIFFCWGPALVGPYAIIVSDIVIFYYFNISVILLLQNIIDLCVCDTLIIKNNGLHIGKELLVPMLCRQ